MPEIEIKTEGNESDPLGKKVGILAAVLAVALAVVTIASHRAHTQAVVERTEANDQWTYYQATRIKLHGVELNTDLLTLLGPEKAGSEKVLSHYEDQKKKYEKESEELQSEAKNKDAETSHTEHKALYFDIGEGMLEIGVVLASLYFIARRRIFPVVSISFGVLGIAIAITGALI